MPGAAPGPGAQELRYRSGTAGRCLYSIDCNRSLACAEGYRFSAPFTVMYVSVRR